MNILRVIVVLLVVVVLTIIVLYEALIISHVFLVDISRPNTINTEYESLRM